MSPSLGLGGRNPTGGGETIPKRTPKAGAAAGSPTGVNVATGRVPGGYVRITVPFDDTTLTLFLDEAAPVPSGDFGGWDSVTVPRKRPVVYWSSNPEAGMDVSVLFEKGEQSVARQIQTLRDIGTGTEERRPRQVELTGSLPPQPVDRWVIDDVTWGDSLYTRGGTLIRQAAVIKFREPPSLDALTVRRGGRSKGRTSKGRKKQRYERIRKGETMQEFAARTLGNPSRWREIAKLNPKPPIRDPRKVKDGRRLKLPK